MAAPTSSAWALSSTSCSPGAGRSAADGADEILEEIKTQEPVRPGSSTTLSPTNWTGSA